jgi:hypothetical protein
MPRNLIGLVLVGTLALALAAPVSGGGFHGGGFHGGSRGGFHHGFHRPGCCFGPAFVGGEFLGAALAAPYYEYPYPYVVEVAPTYAPAPPSQAPAYVAPPIQPEVCYVGGCYHLVGDGLTTAYHWVWVPSPPPLPPGPPTR